MTRGHNIVADGWAGAYNPHPYPRPPRTNSRTQIITMVLSKARDFVLINSITPDGTTDRRTDKASYNCVSATKNVRKKLGKRQSFETEKMQSKQEFEKDKTDRRFMLRDQRPMDARTDKPSYRVVSARLKTAVAADTHM